MSRHIYSRCEMVDKVKLCGESIENNADDIIGNERYLDKVTVTFKISRIIDEPTKINISRDFFPEGEIETIKEENDEAIRRNRKNTGNSNKTKK